MNSLSLGVVVWAFSADLVGSCWIFQDVFNEAGCPVLRGLHLAKGLVFLGGYQAQTCQEPREALSLLEQNPEQVDLVITDLNMPGLDGIELAAELLKINPTLPVVLTSAAIFRMPSEKLRSLGIRDFLPKPWDRGQLFSIIRQALASKSKETQ